MKVPKEINLTNLTGEEKDNYESGCLLEPKYNKIIKETSISRKVDKLSKLKLHDIPVYCYHRLFKHIFSKIPINILFKDIGETPLIMAVNQCNLNLVKMLLEENADPNIKNHFGDTALHCAAGYDFLGLSNKEKYKKDNIEIMKLLINANGDINMINSEYTIFFRTPLTLAVRGYNFKMVQLLINSGAEVNSDTLLEAWKSKKKAIDEWMDENKQTSRKILRILRKNSKWSDIFKYEKKKTF